MITTRFNIFISCMVAVAIVLIFLLRGSPNAPAPPLGMERIPDTEIAAIHSIAQTLGPVGISTLQSAAVCLRGLLTVVDNLPPELQVGVFEAGAQYSAWVRFTATEHTDNGAAATGVAIKLHRISGDFVDVADPASGTQDFLFTDRPSLPVADVAAVAEALAKDRLLFDPANVIGLRERGAGRAREQSIFDPMSRWWSAVPYRFGRDRAVKYGLRSCPSAAPPEQLTTSADFTTEVYQRFAKAPECFELMVQFQADAQDMRIENAALEWNEVFAPFEPLALLQIPIQAPDSAAHREQCEQFRFAPWQTLVEHHPLGGINRLARAWQARTMSQ